MVLGKLPVPGRPINWDNNWARAYCACSRCGWGGLDIFLSSVVSLFFLPISGRRPEILSQRAVKSKTTNQPFQVWFSTMTSDKRWLTALEVMVESHRRWNSSYRKQCTIGWMFWV